MGLVSGVFVVVSSLALWLWWYIRIPSSMPKNIPSIPIYVSLLGFWSDMGQDEIYERWLRKPLEQHGAVVIWATGKWSVLVTGSQYLTDMLRNEDVYTKAGSRVKNPRSVISSLVGDNIINAHGANWKLFTSIMKPGMQKRSWDAAVILEDSRTFVDLVLKDQQSLPAQAGVRVNPLIQRWAIQVMGRNFLDTDLGVSLLLILAT
jgi:xanthocillin biosynthesis cytochrome P450 monooxygenase